MGLPCFDLFAFEEEGSVLFVEGDDVGGGQVTYATGADAEDEREVGDIPDVFLHDDHAAFDLVYRLSDFFVHRLKDEDVEDCHEGGDVGGFEFEGSFGVGLVVW